MRRLISLECEDAEAQSTETNESAQICAVAGQPGTSGPANVLLDDRNQIRLADFGQARLSSETGSVLGTLFYMAPEQTEHGARPDVRSDIYSPGALVYTMLTGKPPYSTETASDELASSRSTRENERCRAK